MAAGDPYWNQVVLAMHMDGANASTVFTDLKGHTMTPTGTAQISTAQSKFGGAAAVFGASTANKITSAATTDWGMGAAGGYANPFTVEFQMYPTAYNSAGQGDMIAASGGTFAFSATTGMHWYVFITTSSIAMQWWGENTGAAITAAVSLNVWTHVAFVYDGAAMRLYTNGTLASTTNLRVMVPTTTPSIAIGSYPGKADGATYAFSGYIDDLRITKGVARYTANFTPPALAFPGAPAMISGTVKDSAGAFAPRAVRVHRKSDGALSGATVSHATTGAFAVPSLDASPHYAITHDSDADPYWSNVVLATHFDTDSVIDPYMNTSGDPFMANTVLLLHMDGTNASTVFRDTSSNTKTVTAIGNAQISTAQSQFGGASALFDGTGDALTTPDSADWNFGIGDVTIEAFIRPTSLAANMEIIVQRLNSITHTYWLFRVEVTTGKLKFVALSSNVVVVERTSTAAVSAGVWSHVALVRSAGVTSLFINGVDAVATGTDSAAAFPDVAAPIYIGAANDGLAFSFNGHIDEVRITKGVARYTSGFTPPAAAFPDPAGVVLGLHMEGATASTVFQDVTGKTVTANGTVALSTDIARFGNTSAKFDGTGDYLTVPDSTDWAFGTGDFTVEAWVYRSVAGATHRVVAQRVNTDANNLFTFGVKNDNTLSLAVYTASVVVTNISSVTTIPALVWTHVAATRSAGVAKLWVNGVNSDTVATNLTSAYPDLTTPLVIGRGFSDFDSEGFNGYLDEIRITKGVARYTATFTPPTVPFSSFKDLTGKDLMVNGTPSISTVTKKYGSGALSMNGVTDYLSIPYSASLDVGAEAFTLEFWAYLTSISGAVKVVYVSRATSSTQGVSCFFNNADSKFTFNAGDTDTASWNVTFTESGTTTLSSWSHYAVCRHGDVWLMFKNGVLERTASGSFTVAANNKPHFIGVSDSGAGHFSGIIDDFRITKGVARYQANFTPPERSFPGAMTTGTSNALIFDDLTPI